MNDTIAAIAAMSDTGALSVLRISGPRAKEIASRVFAPRDAARDVTALPGYTALLGDLADADGAFDEAVLLNFNAPKSYTGEDVVELMCHGGRAVTMRALSAVLDAGARMAQPGEFTRRAFVSGRMSLTQAESVADMVAAQGRTAAKAAYTALRGSLFETIRDVTARLTAVSAHMTAWTDFPEEDVPDLGETELRHALTAAADTLELLLRDYDRGQLVRHGVRTAIVGRPNVGKSTLMNLLSREDRSIVTDIPGTTRDVIEHTVQVNGVTLRLFDTAGLRTTDDPIEKEGVERARRALDSADLVLAVFDGSQPLTQDDNDLIALLDTPAAVAVLNKRDVGEMVGVQTLGDPFAAVVPLSAKRGDGLDALTAAFTQAVGLSGYDPAAPALANARQRACAKQAYELLREALEALVAGVTLDAVGVTLEAAVDALLSLTGERTSDTIIDEVFESFCVGK